MEQKTMLYAVLPNPDETTEVYVIVTSKKTWDETGYMDDSWKYYPDSWDGTCDTLGLFETMDGVFVLPDATRDEAIEKLAPYAEYSEALEKFQRELWESEDA